MKREPGRGIAGAERVTFDQFEPRHALQHEEHGRLIDLAGGDLRIATGSRLDIQREGFGLRPERIVVEWRQPLFYILSVTECPHPEIVSD